MNECRTKNRQHALLAPVLASAAILAGCAGPMANQTTDRGCLDADARLGTLLQRLEATQSAPDGCASEIDAMDCRRLPATIEQLSVACPSHIPSLLANAVLAYDEGRMALAQQYLDALFSTRPAEPAAAVLRTRIALQGGDIPFALRFTADQITLSPAHAGLREARASTLFLAGRFEKATAELAIAERLGAPAWRVAYNRGLIAERMDNAAEAARQFEAALVARPGWKPAADRLQALRARRM